MCAASDSSDSSDVPVGDKAYPAIWGRATQESVQWDSGLLQNGSELSSHPVGIPLFDHPKGGLSVCCVNRNVGEDLAISLGRAPARARQATGRTRHNKSRTGPRNPSISRSLISTCWTVSIGILRDNRNRP